MTDEQLSILNMSLSGEIKKEEDFLYYYPKTIEGKEVSIDDLQKSFREDIKEIRKYYLNMTYLNTWIDKERKRILFSCTLK